MLLNTADLQKHLTQAPFPQPTTKEKLSAVLFVLQREANEHSILFTKRSSHLKSHPGQISFPGGTMDTADPDLLFTALREWEEEMGVSREHLQLLGKWDEMETRTGYHITSFLAESHKRPSFQPDRNEVEDIFYIPLAKFWELPFYSILFGELEIFYLPTEHGLLWGATAEMVVGFLRKVTGFNRSPILSQPNLSGPPFFQP